MEDEDEEELPHLTTGLPQAYPVIMDSRDTLTIKDIERMVDETPTIDASSRSSAQAMLDLEEVDEIVHEFTRTRFPRLASREERLPPTVSRSQSWTEESSNRMNDVLFAVMNDHSAKMSDTGPLTEDDIPRLREEWKKSCHDIMQGAPEQLPPLRDVNHRIPLIDENKRYRYHLPRCADAMRPQLSEKIARYTRANWWTPCHTEQAAPMLCIPKKNTTLRTVIDARERNDNTEKDVTPLPDQDLIRLDVARAKIRSKIDFSDAYEQIRVQPDDVHKTSFATVYGTFVSNVMQQGDCNAPSTFQRAMNHIFRDFIGIFLHVYLDDLFVYSKTVDEHQRHLKLVFDRIRQHRFYLREDKCELFADRIDCLGHVIDEKGLHADADKMAKIRNWHTPRNYHEVQRFLGLVQYLAHFLPDILAYTGPISVMEKNGRPFFWTPLHDKCFQMIKAICCRTPILRPIDHDRDEPIWVICDASVYGVGAMYGQGPTWQTCRPAGFMSKKFTDAQRNYRVFEQETLAILEALLKWEDKLIGYRVHVVTDHQALEFFKTQLRLSSRQTRWMEYLSRFDFDIRYVKGNSNKVADALSRYYEHDSWADVPELHDYVNADVRLDPEHDDLPWDRFQEVKDKVIENRVHCTNNAKLQVELAALRERLEDRDVIAAEMAAVQNKEEKQEAPPSIVGDDPTIFESRAKGENLHERMTIKDSFDKDVREGYQSDTVFRKILVRPESHPNFTVKDEFVWTTNRGGENVLCIPSSTSKGSTLYGRIIDQAHTIVGHFGPQKTADYARRWYWWPRLQVDVEKFCASCEVCARSKGEYQAPAGKLHPLPIPTRPWESIGMDFTGPFPEVDGYNYLWVVICRLTSMVHLVPVNTTTTASQLSVIYMREIVRLHGLPSSIVSD